MEDMTPIGSWEKKFPQTSHLFLEKYSQIGKKLTTIFLFIPCLVYSFFLLNLQIHTGTNNVLVLRESFETLKSFRWNGSLLN